MIDKGASIHSPANNIYKKFNYGLQRWIHSNKTVTTYLSSLLPRTSVK